MSDLGGHASAGHRRLSGSALPATMAVTTNAAIDTCPSHGFDVKSKSIGSGESIAKAHRFSQRGTVGRWIVTTVSGIRSTRSYA